MQQLDRPYARTFLLIAIAYLAFGLISVVVDLKGLLGMSEWGLLSGIFSANWPEVLYILGLFVLLIFSFIVFGENEDVEKA